MAKGDGRGGARPGAGRKSRAEEAGVPQMIGEIISNKELFTLLVDKAREGEQKAVELLLSYSVGKPTKEINLNADVTSNFSVDDIKDIVNFK